MRDLSLLMNYKHSDKGKLNYMLIPVTEFDTTEEGAREFNKIYHWCLEQDWLKPIVRTPSGGISIKLKNIRAMWDIRQISAAIEITIVCFGKRWRFQFRPARKTKNPDEETKGLTGRKAFSMFKEICRKHGIDMDDYKIAREEGYRIKETIEKPLICVYHQRRLHKTFPNCYHVDFHQSYPAGLVNTHPEFKPVVEEIYKLRKEKGKTEYKFVLDATIGFFHSKTNPIYAQLARDAIADNNKRVLSFAADIEHAGYSIIGFNTDGIWYWDTGRKGPYHGEGEGKNYGQWENDHFDCTLYYKSNGCYEFMENGKCTAVVRGSTRLDRIKPREDWEWHDILRLDAVTQFYKLIEGEGVVLYEQA